MSKPSILKDITKGLFGSLIDLLLWQIFLVGASFGKSGPRGVHQAFREADELLSQVNHRTLAATWHQLTKKGLLTYKKRDNLYHPEITKFGKKRLEERLPQYHFKRPWDKRIYLITYDIPETSRKKRDIFRYFLRQLGGRLFQESVWITPYNPREIIHEFVAREKVPGAIIISDIGQDGGIGETNIQDLLVKLYSLEKINDRYEEFIKNAKERNKPAKYLLIEYLSILKDDPQLPFELLPSGWLGDKAYSIYQGLQEEYILSISRSRNR